MWSLCDRFVAVVRGAHMVDVLDSATLQRLQTLEIPQAMSTSFARPVFSPDSRSLCLSTSHGHEASIVSWDLQTGGIASIIRWPARVILGAPITYSANGRMVGIFHRRPGHSKESHIPICDVVSGVPIYSRPFNDVVPLSGYLWAHDESLRFATGDAATFTIWEVGFTGATPVEVETLPAPDGFDEERKRVKLLPALCRLALVFAEHGRVLVWDARNSSSLLECTEAEFSPLMLFSSDGRFFACSTTGSDVYLWKESPAGYTHHGIFASSAKRPKPLLAQNGESIITSGYCTIQLWRTERFTVTPPSGILTEAPQRTNDFILEFSGC